jgi:hypothetical protein
MKSNGNLTVVGMLRVVEAVSHHSRAHVSACAHKISDYSESQ